MSELKEKQPKNQENGQEAKKKVKKKDRRIIKIELTDEGVKSEIRNMHGHEVLGLLEQLKLEISECISERKKSARFHDLLSGLFDER